MRSAETTAGLAEPPARRVRDQARAALALMAFSAATSAGLAAALLLVTRLLTPVGH